MGATGKFCGSLLDEGLLPKLSLKYRKYQGYDEAMDHNQILEKYHSSAISFVDEGAKISAEGLKKSKDGEWSAAFVIHHIADAEIQFGVRYANALCEENPTIVPFDEEKFPTGLQYEKRSVDVSLQSLAASHAMNYEILKNASAADWDRVSTHPQRGAVTLLQLVTLSANHIAGHIEQLKNAAI
jgi:DinB superfamily